MNPLYIFVILAATLIGTMILVEAYIINKTVKKHIIPVLESKSLTFQRYKWTGFWSVGDFSDDAEFKLFNMQNSFGYQTRYVYIFYRDGGINKRITAKVTTFLGFIDTIEYSTGW